MTPHASMARMAKPARKRIMLVASTGGHWIQLLRLAPTMEACEKVCLSTSVEDRHDVVAGCFHAVTDASRWNRVRMLLLAMQVLCLVAYYRPAVVVSTGAAPGYFALRFGEWFGARTVWLDSIANVSEVSMSGRLVKPYADLYLTQWPHLASADGPECHGSVL